MTEIHSYARMNFPATYDALDAKYPDPEGLISGTVGRLMEEMFDQGVLENQLTEATRAHLGDIATLRLIPAAIDFYQVESRLSDGSNGEAITYYDRIEGLLKLKPIIEARVLKNQSIFEQLAGDDLLDTAQPVHIPKVSSAGTAFITTDPNEFRGINDV